MSTFDAGIGQIRGELNSYAKFTLKPALLSMPIHRKSSGRSRFRRRKVPAPGYHIAESAQYRDRYRLRAIRLFACRAKMPSVLCASNRKDGIVLDNRKLTAISTCYALRNLPGESPGTPGRHDVVPAKQPIYRTSVHRSPTRTHSLIQRPCCRS